MESGVLSVITPGTAVMLLWSVDSWDSLCLVRMTICLNAIRKHHVHINLDALLQELFHIRVPTLEVELDQL